MPEWITNGRRDVFTPGYEGSEPSLTIDWTDGRTTKMTGDDALANYGGPEGQQYRAKNPAEATRRTVRGPEDPRFTYSHRAGKALRDIITDKGSMYHKIMNAGPIAGGAVAAPIGLLGGVLANWASDAATENLGFAPRMVDYRLLGALLAGAAGAYAGHKHATTAPVEKSAAMFVDPRNFILEKLQSANDVSASDKVKLAAAIRRMDKYQADQLAKRLRSILGFGVGAAIARALGMSLGGSLFGGILGVMGSGLLSSMNNAKANNARMFL